MNILSRFLALFFLYYISSTFSIITYCFKASSFDFLLYPFLRCLHSGLFLNIVDLISINIMIVDFRLVSLFHQVILYISTLHVHNNVCQFWSPDVVFVKDLP